MKYLLLAAVTICAGCSQRGPEPIRIAMISNSTTHLPVLMAEHLGFYRQEGVEVVIEFLPSAQKTAEAILSASADLAVGGYDQTLQLSASGRAVRSIVVIGRGDARAIVASPLRKDIRTLADLRGKNIGVPGLGSSNYFFVLHVLGLRGMTKDDASFAGVGIGRTAIAALERGTVDGAVLTGGDLVRFRARNPGAPILADATTVQGSKAIWGVEFIPTAALFGAEETIVGNREKFRRVGRACVLALEWLAAHTAEEIHAAVPEEFRTSETELDIAGFRFMKNVYSRDGVMPEGGPEALLRALSRTQEQLRSAKIDLQATYTNEFVKK